MWFKVMLEKVSFRTVSGEFDPEHLSALSVKPSPKVFCYHNRVSGSRSCSLTGVG